MLMVQLIAHLVQSGIVRECHVLQIWLLRLVPLERSEVLSEEVKSYVQEKL